jgi:hypothetical protein
MRDPAAAFGVRVFTELVAVTVTAGLAVALATFMTFLSKRRRSFQPLALVWKQYAETRGMRFIFVPDRSYATTIGGKVPAIAGEVQGVPLTVTVESARGVATTRVDAVLLGVTDDFLFAIHRRSPGSRDLQDLSNMVETPTGNKVFDAKFALYSNNSDLSRSILDRRLAQVIGEFPREFSCLHVNQTRFTLGWHGMEKAPQILDAAILVVSTACRRRA